MNKSKVGFDDLFCFENEHEELEHNAQMISFRVLSEVEKVCDKNGINKTDLAQKLETSKSYITQLFRGDKQINVKMMARIERAFGVQFSISITQKPSTNEQ